MDYSAATRRHPRRPDANGGRRIDIDSWHREMLEAIPKIAKGLLKMINIQQEHADRDMTFPTLNSMCRKQALEIKMDYDRVLRQIMPRPWTNV